MLRPAPPPPEPIAPAQAVFRALDQDWLPKMKSSMTAVGHDRQQQGGQKTDRLHTWNRVDPTSSDVNSLDVAPLHANTKVTQRHH